MIIATAGQAADLLAPLFASSEGELVAAIHLGEGGRLLAITLEEGGCGGAAELPIPSMVAKALLLKAEAMVIAHNHPSGNPSPSPADREATRALAGAAAGVGVRLHDHLIFGTGECSSFRELGLI